MKSMRMAIALGVLAGAGAAMAQAELVGYKQYPQFRNLSGLPGGGFGINAEGHPDFKGAMAYSTPIAYTLTDWRMSLGGSALSRDRSFYWFGGNDLVQGNGTGFFMLGVPLGRFGDFTASWMFLSELGDNVVNLQWSPPWQQGDVRYAVGVQDVVGGGGSSGEGQTDDSAASNTWYVVATYRAQENLHMSLGAGDKRFNPVFGNISYDFAERWKAVVEHDSFNWNYGIAYDLGRLAGQGETWDGPGRGLNGTVMIGLVKGKFAFWNNNFAF